MNTAKLFVSLSLTAACLLPTAASAACIVCFPYTGTCYSFPNSSCNELSGAGGVCFTLGPKMFKPTDHVLMQNGQPFLVQGSKKTPLASDKVTAFWTNMNAKYPSKSADTKSKKEISKAWATFLKGDTGKVSLAQASDFAKEMGLSVRQR